jgi:hypothetical protein
MKKIYLLKYDHSNNIGDNIQSLVSKKILEKLNYEVNYLNQNDLHKKIEKKDFFINGFFCFSDNDKIFPFNENITPYFSNFHLELDYLKDTHLKKNFFTNKKNINYFKKYEPIGSRDEDTKKVLEEYGIKAQNNECITFLLEKRGQEYEDRAKKIILVDVDEFIPIPKKMKKHTEYMTHILANKNLLSNQGKLNLSEDILRYYKENAKVVITSRFHCAIPCIAMGIPVIFFGDPNSARLKPLKNYIKIYPYIHLGLRHRTLFKKLKFFQYIPFLGRNVSSCYSILDLTYTFFYKIFLNFLYKINFIKVNWDVKNVDIENMKNTKICEIIKLLKINKNYSDELISQIRGTIK